MKDLIELIKKSKTIGISFAICAVILAIGISWALASADNLTIESKDLKIQLSNN